MMDLTELRPMLIAQRNKISEETVVANSAAIYAQISKMEVYRQAEHVGLYQAFGREINVEEIRTKAPLHGKKCYFPICSENKLAFVPANLATSFTVNKYGILEPDVSIDNAIDLSLLDLVLTPLLAFDELGGRLGMGKGYYDKTFGETMRTATSPPVLLGMAHESQKYPHIDVRPWDVLLHGTVTEKTTYWTNPS